MDDILPYLEGTGGVGVVAFLLYKYGIPSVKKLYKELLDLREENKDIHIKNAKLESENDYLKDKYVHRSHGKKGE